MMRLSILLLLCCCVIAVPVQADKVEQARVGRAVERHLPSDEDFMQWVIDAERLKEQAGDRLEVREVVMVEPQTVKLDNIVPPIHFESGIAQVPDSTVQELRTILEKMRHRVNVRLNLVGHTDDQPLSAELAMNWRWSTATTKDYPASGQDRSQNSYRPSWVSPPRRGHDDRRHQPVRRGFRLAENLIVRTFFCNCSPFGGSE